MFLPVCRLRRRGGFDGQSWWRECGGADRLVAGSGALCAIDPVRVSELACYSRSEDACHLVADSPRCRRTARVSPSCLCADEASTRTAHAVHGPRSRSARVCSGPPTSDSLWHRVWSEWWLSHTSHHCHLPLLSPLAAHGYNSLPSPISSSPCPLRVCVQCCVAPSVPSLFVDPSTAVHYPTWPPPLHNRSRPCHARPALRSHLPPLPRPNLSS